MTDYCWKCGWTKEECQCHECHDCGELVSEPVQIGDDYFCTDHAAKREADEIVSNMHSMEFVAKLCGMGAVK